MQNELKAKITSEIVRDEKHYDAVEESLSLINEILDNGNIGLTCKLNFKDDDIVTVSKVNGIKPLLIKITDLLYEELEKGGRIVRF